MKIKNIFFKSIDSTQVYAKKNYQNFEKNMITCISADSQTKGIGRYSNKWVSSIGNIFSTYYFTLDKTTKDLQSLGLILAISIIKIFQKYNIDARIKWPNDILIQGKKVSGILCEIFSEKDLFHIFLGIGINVNMEEKDLLKIDQKATSLKKETGKIWDKNKLLQEMQEQFLQDLKNFYVHGFKNFFSFFKKHLLYKKQKIEIQLDDKKYEGILLDITKKGGIVLLQKTEKKIFYSGIIKKM